MAFCVVKKDKQISTVQQVVRTHSEILVGSWPVNKVDPQNMPLYLTLSVLLDHVHVLIHLLHTI